MPLKWKLVDWLRETSLKRRLRRQPWRTRLPVEGLEQRVVPAATGSVSGFAFINANGSVDANGDGTRDFVDLDNSGGRNADGSEDELKVKGTALRLTGRSTAGETVNAQTTTDQQGAFTFRLVPAGTYTLKADSNAAISGTLGDGVTVVVGTTSVTKDVPIDGIVVTGELLLSTNVSITELETLEDFPLPVAGTGQSTGINEAPMLRSGQPLAINVAPSPLTTVDLTGVFDDPNVSTSQIQIHTTDGDVNLNLFDVEAPKTVQNFYNYINSGAYDDSIFHRRNNQVGVNVLQGGGFEYTPEMGTTDPTITAIPVNPAVQNEFDADLRSNVAGTIAMAKTANPDSATSQFFFNLADNSSQLDLTSNSGGFTVFGRVVGETDDASLSNSVITSLAATAPTNQSGATAITDANVRGALGQLPLRGTPGDNFPTNTTAANFLQITGIDTIVRDEELTYSVVSNSNRALFSTPDQLINNNRLALNFVTNASGDATIVVRATDKKGLSTGTVDNPDAIFQVTANARPVFTSAASANVQENSTPVLTATATDANLPMGESLTFSKVGGADQALFNITETGVLTFQSAPDRENPTDADMNNIYVVQIQADDGNGGTTTQTINVTVTPLNETGPVFTSESMINRPENSTTVLTVVATDADLPAQNVTYSIVGGDDQGSFDITSAGVLTFASAPDFEIPADMDGNNSFAVEVQASDGNGLTNTQSITVVVDDANDDPEITSATSVDVPENTIAVLTVMATDADLPAQMVTFSLVASADQEFFNITNSGELTFISPPSFDTPLDEDANNVYVVDVQVDDGNGGLRTQTIMVNVLDVP